jgi:integration host factor subunit alpha
LAAAGPGCVLYGSNGIFYEAINLERRHFMTKADIVEIIYEKIGFSRKESAEIVDLVFDLLKETLEIGDKVKISGFGNFIVRQKRSRKGRNPQTGEEIQITARRVLTFKPSQVLRKALNKATPE